MSEKRIKATIQGVKISDYDFEIKLIEDTYDVVTTWRWGDYKEKEHFESSKEEVFHFEKKNEAYLWILNHLDKTKGLKISLKKEFLDLKEEMDGNAINVNFDSGVYECLNIYINFHDYVEVLKNKNIELDSFNEFVNNFFVNQKSNNVDIYMCSRYIERLFTEEEKEFYVRDYDTYLMYKAIERNENIYINEQFNDTFIGLDNLDIQYHERPKSIKNLIHSSNITIFKYKHGRYFDESVSVLISKCKYNTANEYYEAAKDSLYKYVQNTPFSAVKKRKDYITTLYEEPNGILIVYFKEIEESDINKSKNLINRYKNGYELLQDIESNESDGIEVESIFMQETQSHQACSDIVIQNNCEVIQQEQQKVTMNNNVFCITTYNPYWINNGVSRIKNPNFRKLEDGMMLNLKKDGEEYKHLRESAINYYYEIYKEFIKPLIKWPMSAVIVPSSKNNKYGTGLSELVMKLCEHTQMTYYPGILKRVFDIKKLADGGKRDINIHLSSIEIDNEVAVKGKVVLLVDDVTTTGNSLLACEQILLDSGALFVVKLALAKTSSEHLNLRQSI